MAVLEFSKDFDTIPHQMLLRKLEQYVINGQIQSWISGLLTSQEKCVVVDVESSVWVSMDTGMPQSTVLHPLLFLIHINDLPSQLISQARLFANDGLL